jgi:hypothetical protein
MTSAGLTPRGVTRGLEFLETEFLETELLEVSKLLEVNSARVTDAEL